RLESLRLRSEFYREWELGLREKQGHATTLERIGPQREHALEAMRAYLIEGLRKGRPLGVVLKARTELFTPLELALLVTGDAYGSVRDSLRLLSEWYLRDLARMSRLRGLMGIPIFLGVAAAFVIPFPIVY